MEERRITPDEWPEAVADVTGPQIIVAGPGTGKTEFLVRRAVHLIDSGLARTDCILVLTFSRRGAADLRRRITTGLGGSTVPIASSTFHSFAMRLLETHATGVLGWDGVPTLLTGPEHVALVAELLGDHETGAWPVLFRGILRSPSFAADVADFLLRCSERLIGPEQLEEMAEERADWRALPGFYRRYVEVLRQRQRIDYGSLLEAAVVLLDEDEPVRDSLAAQHNFVLVDEYQDTSPAQAALLDRLTAPHRNLTVAADPYQSIYSFRGAELENVVSFPDRFRALDGRPAVRIVLGTSFRVPAEILDGALRITSGGELPGGAGPVTPAPHAGSVEAHIFDQASAEAEWIASELERLNLVDRIPYRSMAVLVRSKRYLLPELSRALERRRIPHDTPDARLVDHPACRIVFDIAVAAALAGSTDPLAAEELDRTVRRLLLGPLFGLSIGAERDLLRTRRRTGRSWTEILPAIPAGDRLSGLLTSADWAIEKSAVEGFWWLWDRLPNVDELVAAPERRDFRSAWASFAQALERQHERDPSVSLLEYWRRTSEDDFEATPLLRFDDPVEDRLTLTTLHQAKGLEFDVVFIADAAEGVFPDLRRGVSLLQPHALAVRVPGDAASFARFRLQEEMRLAYTAMTRARRRVVWTATAAGIDEAERRPSRFLLSAAGVTSVEALEPPTEETALTPRAVQARLRRILSDPGESPARRLAAAAVLTKEKDHWSAERFAGVRERGPDLGVVTAPFRLSPSQAESYRDCPRRYAMERRLRVSDTSGASAHFGTLVHAALERADRHAIEDGADTPGLGEALAALGEIWGEEADFGSHTFNRIWYRKAVEVVTRMFAEWPASSGPAVLVEHPMSLRLGDIEWIGRADRIERGGSGSLRVVDYKTSSRAPTVSEAAESLQLGFYLLAARQDPTVTGHGPVTEAEAWYPRSSLKDWRRRFDPDRADEIEARLIEIGAGIRSEDWAPRTGEACRYCTVRGVCPQWPEGREAFSV